MVGVLVALLIVGTPEVTSDAPVVKPAGVRHEDGSVTLTPRAVEAIDLELKRCQAAEKDKATAAVQGIDPAKAAVAGLVIGLAIGVAATAAVAGVAIAASRRE